MEPISVSQLGHPPQPIYPPQPPPAQPTTFSSEPSMNTNAGMEELTKVITILDKESIKILQDASGVHAESIVNLGIKLFAKTNIYKEFMLKPDYKTIDTITEDIITLSSVANASTVPMQSGLVNAKPSVSQAIGGNIPINAGIAPVSSW